ncbi:MAG: hypothetical protein ACRDTM_04790 [Micromonosporaceae bacterium]
MVRAADTLVWAESRGTGGALWRLELPGGEPVRITTDTGPVVSLESRYDLVVDAGRVWWTARPPAGKRTQIRSVALEGGAVAVDERAGEWSLAAWPTLSDAAVEAPAAPS